jgi:hypothetical protein
MSVIGVNSPGVFGSLLHMPAEATGDFHNSMMIASTGRTNTLHFYTFIVWVVYGQEK